MNAPNGRWLIITVAAATVVGVTASLGVWQLGRAADKETRQAQIEAQAALAPLDNRAVLALGSADASLHQAVTLRGEWLSSATLLLDNRPMAGQVGFWVLTPLRLSDSTRVLMVNRGWAPRDFLDRTRWPEFQTPTGVVSLQGRLTPPVSELYELGPSGSGPMRQNMRLADYAQETGLDFLPVTVQQTDPSGGGLRRDWPVITAKVHTHYGYAFQWFALSALTAGLYLWFQWISPRRKRNSHGTQAR